MDKIISYIEINTRGNIQPFFMGIHPLMKKMSDFFP